MGFININDVRNGVLLLKYIGIPAHELWLCVGLDIENFFKYF